MSNQWIKRPTDAFYQSLQELREHVEQNRSSSYERNCRLELLNVRANTTGGVVIYDTRNPQGGAQTSHYSFAQVCARAKAPAGFLRSLPAELTCNVLNHTLAYNAEPGEGKLLLIHETGEPLPRLRAITGPGYGRIWDVEVCDTLMGLVSPDWQCLQAGVSDRDMFIFLVNPAQAYIVDEHSLQPGVFVWNSETGKNVFGVQGFIYDATTGLRLMCDKTGDARGVRIRHNRRAPTRFTQEALPDLSRHLEADITDELSALKRARDMTVGADVPAVQKWLQRQGFAAQVTAATGTTLRALPEKTPLTLWTVEQALASVARDMPFMDERVELERKAGKLLAA